MHQPIGFPESKFKITSKMSSFVENMSLFIPRVFENITQERIIKKIEEIGLGKVSHVDLVLKKGHNDVNYNGAYIHFEYWNNTEYAQKFQASVRDLSNETRIVYDAPWFWIVLENTAKKHTKRKTCVDLTDFANNMELDEENSETHVKMIFEEDAENEDGEVEDVMDEEEFLDELEDVMDEEEFLDELEELMDEEEKHLCWIDTRYVQQIEHENALMRQELARLNCQVREQDNLLLARIYTNLPPEQAGWIRSKLGL